MGLTLSVSEKEKHIKNLDHSGILQAILDSGQASEAQVQKLLELMNPIANDVFHMAVIDVGQQETWLQSGSITAGDSDMIHCINRIYDQIHKSIPNVLIEEYKGSYLLLFSCEPAHDEDFFRSKLSKVMNNLGKSYRNFCIHIGFSSAFDTLDRLGSAYKEASETTGILKKTGMKTSLCAYPNGNLVQFLCGRSREDIDGFLKDTLGKLIQHDKHHKSNYIETLSSYIINKCNMNTTAEKLFIHRHTLRYRLAKINELCRIDLEDYQIRLKYSIALYLYSFYR